jgi:hypothetical protein
VARSGNRSLPRRAVETIQALASYWAGDYDWRKFEERFAALPQFVTEIDGVDIHFIHVRSEHQLVTMARVAALGVPGALVEVSAIAAMVPG